MLEKKKKDTMVAMGMWGPQKLKEDFKLLTNHLGYSFSEAIIELMEDFVATNKELLDHLKKEKN